VSLFLDYLGGPDQRPIRAEAEDGEWVPLEHHDPDAVVQAMAGTGPGTVSILLDARQLAALNAQDRFHAGLAVATCRLPELPTMRVADVLLLGLRAPRPHLWQTVAGTKRAHTMARDDEAHVRALAGRLGLAHWLDGVAVGLPPEAQALADVTRGLAAVPRALVLRSPQWLAAADREGIVAAIRDEQERQGFAVVEVISPDERGPGDA
jgi:ABC-type branched-subunit amino acid transport system ATPase component